MVDYADTPMSSNFDGCTCVRTVDDKGRRKKKLMLTNNGDGYTVHELKKKKLLFQDLSRLIIKKMFNYK